MTANPRRTTRSAVARSGNESLSLNTATTLRKSPTFHSPTSPSSSLASFTPPSIRRCQTNLDDVVDAHRRRAAMVLDEYDSLSMDHISPKKTTRDRGLPLPAGLLDLPVVDPAMANSSKSDRRQLRPRDHRRTSGNRASDSGLGTSIASTPAKVSIGSKKSNHSAISRSAASTMENHPGLSPRAVSRITEHIIKPLLAKPSLEDFKPIVLDVPRRIRDKEIICLRDLEKTLIFMAPERTKTPDLYLDFCLTSVRCIKSTAEYLSDREKIKPSDRPYTNLYFMDLEAQLRDYASRLADAKDKESQGQMGYDISDEVRLHGGLTKNGRPAELVRVKKDGKAFSMATGEPIDLDEDIDSPVRFKRSLSEGLEEDEDVLRSMARRKKNPTPEELAPKKCTAPGCNKEFQRPCDLTKHEKTHSRPWKCPEPTCKYHKYGWPTQKELDRHHNDKHSDAPAMYECRFQPCPYKSKRESNCKQHMEKAHGWTYVRTKTNRKKVAGAGSTVHPTPPLTNMSTPDSHNMGVPTPPAEHEDQFMALPANSLTFPKYLPDDELLNAVNQPPAHMPELDAMDMDLDLGMSPAEPVDVETPSTESFGQYSFQDGTDFILDDDIYTANMQMPEHNPALFDKVMEQTPFLNYGNTMDTRQSVATPTPHISPIGQANAMLFTPKSCDDLDEGFEGYSNCQDGFEQDQDFQLFPQQTKMGSYEPLFNNEVPSAGLGYSQQSQDIFPTGMDWNSHDFGHFGSE